MTRAERQIYRELLPHSRNIIQMNPIIRRVLTIAVVMSYNPILTFSPATPLVINPIAIFRLHQVQAQPTYFQQYRLLTTLKNLSDPIIKSLGCDSALFCGWETECSYTGSSGFNYGVSSLNAALSNPNVIVIPPATPTPTPGPTGQGGNIYACAYDAGPPPHANCNSYPSAKDKGCVTFSDPVICQQACDQSRSNWCY